VDNVTSGDRSVEGDGIRGAREVAGQGARGVITTCGFTSIFRKRTSAALDISVTSTGCIPGDATVQIFVNGSEGEPSSGFAPMPSASTIVLGLPPQLRSRRQALPHHY